MTARLRHPSIVMLIAAVLDLRNLCICLELGTHGTVGSAVRKRDAPIGRATALRFAASLARGVEYLHGHTPPHLGFVLRSS